MTRGPGKYTDLCDGALAQTHAKGVVLIVMGGNRGSGFSVSSISPLLINQVPGILREIAEKIEKDITAGGTQNAPTNVPKTS